MHLSIEYNKASRAVEVYGDHDGLTLLIKRLMDLRNKEPGSYFSFDQGEFTQIKPKNTQADYYSAFKIKSRDET